MDQTELIVLKGLDSGAPAALTPIQTAILPYVPDIIIIWWAVWIGVFSYMFIRYLVLPAFKND